MKKLLYVDACVNRSTSRTERLARALLGRLVAEGDWELEEVVLEDEALEPLTGQLVLERVMAAEL